MVVFTIKKHKRDVVQKKESVKPPKQEDEREKGMLRRGDEEDYKMGWDKRKVGKR